MLRPIYSLSTICYVDFDDLNNKHNIVLSSPTLFSLISSFYSLYSILILPLFLYSHTLFSILTLTLHHPTSCPIMYDSDNNMGYQTHTEYLSKKKDIQNMQSVSQICDEQMYRERLLAAELASFKMNSHSHTIEETLSYYSFN